MSQGNSNARPRLLLIGPLPIEGDVVGGTKVLFAQMVDAFRESDRYELVIHNSSRARRGKNLVHGMWLDLCGLLSVICAVWMQAPKVDLVFWNVSAPGMLKSGLLVWLAARMRRTPLAIRFFGGDLGTRLDHTGPLRRSTAHFALRNADLVFLETVGLCERFGDWQNLRQLPNTRDLELLPREERSAGTRFLFLAHVWPEKGLLHALGASDSLPEGSSIEFFGSLKPDASPAIFDAHPRSTYHGPARPEDVPSVFAAHDVFVFPTMWEAEGMPGSVLEAMQAGMPVVAFDWPYAAEMIDDGVSGLIVERGSTAALAQALCLLEGDRELRTQMGKAAVDKGDTFRSGPWHARVERWIAELLGAEQDSSPQLLSPSREVA